MWLNAWRFVVQLFYISVVCIVLSQLEGRFETLVVTLAGIIYVTVRYGFINQASLFMTLGIALRQEFDGVKRLINSDLEFNAEAHQDRLKELADAKNEMYFHVGGLWVISLICLVRLLSVLF